MKNLRILTGTISGLLVSAPLIALMYLGNQLAGLPFVPFDLFDWMTRVLPGSVVTFGIDSMINIMLWLGVNVAEVAKLTEQTIAIVQFLAGGIVAGIVFGAVINIRGIKMDNVTGIVIAALFGLPLIAISLAIGPSTVWPFIQILWLAFLFLCWGLALSRTYHHLIPIKIKTADQEEISSAERLNRRQFLIRMGAASAVVTVVGAGVGALLASEEQRRLKRMMEKTMAHKSETSRGPSFPNINDPVMPAPGTRPEYTPIKDHYRVFLRTRPTVIDGSTWVLPITGMVDNPLMLTLDEIKNNYKAHEQYVTISCISGKIGSSLIGTTQWTGASLQDILHDAGVQPGARYINITSGDGFYETVDLNLVTRDKRIMFCYAWDGHDLPIDHGYPLRIWIPDRYGMKQPKWITSIEVTKDYKKGYWVKRGWDETARVKATSVIDTVAVNAPVRDGSRTLIPVGGIAFSGARGISKVEIRVDNGAWEEAKLRSPLSETTWVIWRYDWSFKAGEHTFEVRCAEGDGTPQIVKKHKSHPSGATGLDKYKTQS